MSEVRPNRTLGGVHDQFWRFCAGRELRLQQCNDCSAFVWPPVDSCEECGGLELQWSLLSGAGRLKSWATFEQKYYDVLPLPWQTILVELAEGPLFVSNPLGFRKDDMVLDLPVQVDFIECEDDKGAFLLPVFRKSND
jgi:uncharacterized OB-fold protein